MCPFNVRFAEETAEPGYAGRGPGERPVGVERLPGEGVSAETHPSMEAPSLVALLRVSPDPGRWGAFSRGSAIRRAGRAGVARNVCVAIGNSLAGVDEPPEEALAVLWDAFEDESELVREHAGWALDRGSAAS